MRSVILAAATLAVAGSAALADRPVNDEERTRLNAAIAAQGCSGGRMEFDDGKFEVDDARCADGKVYELDFDQAMNLTKKKLKD